MEEQHTETTIPTFLIPDSSMVPHPLHKSLHVLRRSRRLWRRKDGTREVMMMTVKEENNNNNNGKGCVLKEEEEEEGYDREEIEKKIHALKRIVPNGESLSVDKLFDETAGYIMTLQSQVKALRTLSGFFDKLEKEKTKFGG
ncbi:hypothetical protein TanjilG_00773 [Lupinus angustifolius]|uniref:BHLH domain-containing protein n=1 Tax=Lupinus angustifolius TaxID=3871 RepID=A0A4P1R7K8_LUPAN|nr:PREDICTED: transcription factor PAR1-like [Lupinus angustifolius]OIW04213.1 hypothetical protein TanjilG_00773 [Lupinus angustifolius]